MTDQTSDTVVRLNAALEGRYRIDRELGEGGMATVYLADDLRHERKVAVKVLKPELAAVVGADRFLAEIKTTANLQHPHILPLFDSGEADSFLFYVMPYVEGESIRELITKEKQLGVKEALAITRKVSDALDYAHEHGVVHRDIKPGNILLSERGEPLVADFGIALAVAQAGGGRITETGLSLGTPHYMSPEQATGDRDVDARSDVYALGCVLYEMLSGRPPFSASTAQGVLVQILTTDPPSITGLRRTVPLHIEGVLARALEKLPADRFKSAAGFTRALDDESFVYAPRPMATDPRQHVVAAPAAVQEAAVPKRGRDLRLIAAIGVAAIMTGVAAWGWLQPEPAANTIRVSTADPAVRFPPGSGERLAVSRDGSMIAVATSDAGVDELLIRRVDERNFRIIPGTEGATTPTFSPDGQWLAFSAGGEVKRVEVEGGPVLPIAEGQGAHWGTDDKLVFITAEGNLYQISASGGTPELILEGAGGRARPHLLPDGRAVIFQGPGDFESRNLMVLEIESGEVTDLGIGNVNNPRYISTGHVVYGHGSQALMAVPFDLGSLRTSGDPTTVLPEVLVYGGGATQFAVSENGIAVYAVPVDGGASGDVAQLVMVDKTGMETALPATGGFFMHPRFSPDGRRIAYTGSEGIFVYGLDTGANLAIYEGSSPHSSPWWSRDGEYVYFSVSTGTVTILDGFRRRADGSEPMEQLFQRPRRNIPLASSLNGNQLLVMEGTIDRGWDLLRTREEGDSLVFEEYLRADWNETMPTISPDGQVVAYVSDESGRPEVYASSFPSAESKVRVSMGGGGGSEPVWAPDGSAIYYRDGSRIMRAPILPGRTFSIDTPEELFLGAWTRVPAAFPPPRTNWDITPDGDSFLFVSQPGATLGEGGGEPVVTVEIVVNWFEELRSRIGN